MRPVVERMTERVRHRGPDHGGLWSDAFAALGHRRLSIVDRRALAGQPMVSEDGRFVITYNGEIYNHIELRRQLEHWGYRFRTRCDTEVLLYGLAHGGPSFLADVDGMFAFGLWDRQRRSLLLARDRLGIKPLFYADCGRRLGFASEPKALLAWREVDRALELEALDAYLDLLYVPEPLTMYRGIRRLGPGERLTWTMETPKARVTRYWTLPKPRARRRRFEEWVETADAMIRDAVERRVQADVPVGVFLSGGLDSSTIAAAATRVVPHLETFCVGFEGDAGRSYDERARARRIAAYLGTRHHEVVLDAMVLERLDDVVKSFDEPFGSPTATLVAAISEYAKQHVSVVLAGDGGDELFVGYPRYGALRWSHGLERIPAWMGTVVANLLGGESQQARSLRRRARAFVMTASMAPAERYAAWVGYRDVDERDALLTTDVLDHLRTRRGSVAEAFRAYDAPSPVDRALAADFAGFLPGNVLAGSDRMSMRYGLELRVPLCAHSLVEAMVDMPTHERSGVRGKRVLRAVLQRWLPPSLLPTVKLGFNGPVGAWMSALLARPGHRMMDLLGLDAAIERGLVRPNVVRRQLEEHRRGQRDHGLRLWSLAVLEQWLRTHPMAASP